jgi:hypothetical protein
VKTPDSTVESNRLKIQTQWIKKLSLYEWVVIVLMLLSIIGVAITQLAPPKSYAFWMVMVPVFGVACIVLEWSRARGKGKSWWTILQDQFLHWLGVLGAIYLVYLLGQTEQMNNANSALVILLILALATFLAGIHLGWRLFIVSGFLVAILVLSIFLIDFMWVLIVAGLALVGGYVFWRVKRKPATGQQPPD